MPVYGVHMLSWERIAESLRYCRIMLHTQKCPAMDGGARRYAPRMAHKSHDNSYKSVLAIVCVSTMLTVEMLLLYVVRSWLHVRIY